MTEKSDISIKISRQFHTAKEVVERLRKISCPITVERLTELAVSGYAPCYRWTLDGEQGPPLFNMQETLRWVESNYLTKHNGIKFPTSLTVLCPSKNDHFHPEEEGLPTALTTLSGKLFLLDGLFAVGVYFLVYYDEVVYVGQSTNVTARIATHRNDGSKIFDRAFLLPVPQSELLTVESAFIKALKPKYNGNGNASRDNRGREQCGNIDVAIITYYSPDLARMVFGPDAHMAVKKNKPWPPPRYKLTDKIHVDIYTPVVCWNCDKHTLMKNLVWDQQTYAHCPICGAVLLCDQRKNKTGPPRRFFTEPFEKIDKKENALASENDDDAAFDELRRAIDLLDR